MVFLCAVETGDSILTLRLELSRLPGFLDLKRNYILNNTLNFNEEQGHFHEIGELLISSNEDASVNLKDRVVQFLNSCERPGSFEELTLDSALAIIKSDEYRAEIEQLRGISDKSAYSQAKKLLPCVAFNGSFTDRVTSANFQTSSGLFHFDLDNLDGGIEMHRAAIAAIPSCVFVFISPSGKGLKGALRMNPESITGDSDFKSIFPAVDECLRNLGYEIDASCKDVRRLCFVSHDPDAYVNWEAQIFEWTKPETAAATTPRVSGNFDLSNESLCIQKVTNILTTANPGERHSARLKAGKLAGGFIGGGLIAEDKIVDLLHQLSDSISDGGSTSNSELKTIADAVELGKQSPIQTTGQVGELLAVSDNGIFVNRSVFAGFDVIDGTANTRELSELGNAKRLEDRYGDNIRYIHDSGVWLHWKNGSWVLDLDGAMILSLSAGLYHQIYGEGSLHPAYAKDFAEWSQKSQKKVTISNAVDLFRLSEGIRIPQSFVDSELFCIGIDHARQVIDLNTGNVRASSQEDYITKSVNVSHLGDSTEAVRWLQFLNQVFGDDQELINWLQRWCGYLLTGATNEQFFLFCYGHGSNGKSVLGEILRLILGDYARAMPSETLTSSKRQKGGATPDLVDLVGARLAISSETEDGAALAETLVKSLTGNDAMSARQLYGKQFQFIPQFKILMVGNHRPVIKGADNGIWRRVRMLPFTRTFSSDECDRGLLGKLKAEAPHILKWMVDGCIEWQHTGLSDIPLTIKQATAEYQEDQDLIGIFLDECCDRSLDNTESSVVLFGAYESWCKGNGEFAGTKSALGRKLTERGFRKGKVKQSRGWLGLAVKSGCLQEF